MTFRLAPTVTHDTRFHWDGVRDGKLLVQRCDSCGTVRHPPRPMCPSCNSLAWSALQCSGRGEVFSFVMPQHPPYPWFEYPYIVALIDLEEGVRYVSNLIGVTPEEVTVGMPVEVTFETFDNDLVLPLFRPVTA